MPILDPANARFYEVAIPTNPSLPPGIQANAGGIGATVRAALQPAPAPAQRPIVSMFAGGFGPTGYRSPQDASATPNAQTGPVRTALANWNGPLLTAFRKMRGQ